MSFSKFHATLAVGVFSSLVSAFAPVAVLAQDAPIQAPIDGGVAQPAAPTTSIPLKSLKKSALSDDEIKALGQGPAFPYSLLDEALYGAVNDKGDINYNKLVGNDSLKAFVRAVSMADMSQFPVFEEKDEEGNVSKNQNSELTFWINAYNALFLDTIASAYPIKNVTQIKDLDTAKTHVVAGKKYSFAEMRDVIAGIDSRAVFVLLDGTRSGPRASASAFRSYRLGAQLNAGVKSFVDDITRVTPPDRMGRAVQVSSWMQTVDSYFKPKNSKRKWDGIRNVLSVYVSQGANRRYFGAGDYDIAFFPANTILNDTVTADIIPAG